MAADARIDALQQRQGEGERLARASASLTDDVLPGEQLGDGVGLNGCRRHEALRLEGPLQRGFEIELGERGRPCG